MKYKLILILIMFFSYINIVNACAPLRDSNLIIWKYINHTYWIVPSNKWWKDVSYVWLETVSKIFSWDYNKMWKYFYTNLDNYKNLNILKKWDIIIWLADYQDWGYERYYTLFDLWILTCDKNWKFKIQELLWDHKFWASIWRCKKSDTPEKDYLDLLSKIEEKYKNCDDLWLIMKEDYETILSQKQRQLNKEYFKTGWLLLLWFLLLYLGLRKKNKTINTKSE